jgi:sugar phosphate isomerase/epimerase
MDQMLKLSIAIAESNALPSAFVVFRGFEKHIPVAASLGYDGVELALKSASEINADKLDRWLNDAGIAVSCISTGQVFSDTGLMFTDADKSRRQALVSIFKEMIDLASVYGQMVNIGRVRGNLTENDKGESRLRFKEMIRELCNYATANGVTLVLEPVNRYELNFINSVEEGVDLIKKINWPNIKLMPDVFHMNIEDVTIGEQLAKYIDHIAYIHLADSNRLAPGWGHTNFDDIFSHLKSVNYQGWLSIEILPQPEPLMAAKQAIDYLKPFLENNRKFIKYSADRQIQL